MSTTLFDAYAAARERLLSSAMRRIPEASMASQARALGIWRHNRLHVRHEPQALLAVDLAVFHPLGGHKRAIDREARAIRPPDGSEEARVLDALGRAVFTLFRLGDPAPEGGSVEAEDMLRGNAFTLRDKRLSQNGMQGLAFAGHLMPIEGVMMTCGVVAPLTDPVIETLLGRFAAVEETPRILPPITPLAPEDVIALRAAALAEDFPARVYSNVLDHQVMGARAD
jgi:hypothetical protein